MISKTHPRVLNNYKTINLAQSLFSIRSCLISIGDFHGIREHLKRENEKNLVFHLASRYEKKMSMLLLVVFF